MSETNEINRAIHEKVMNECWHELEVVEDIRGGSVRKHDRSFTRCAKCGKRSTSNNFYATSKALALVVITRFMESEGFLWKIENKQSFYSAEFYQLNREALGGVEDESLPLAICKAALKAKGIL